MGFQKATKGQAYLRLALIGPAGSGKTFTALAIAKGLGSRVALIDTEHASSTHYASKFEYDVDVLESFSPEAYIGAIHDAEKAGYDVLIVDSLSHGWAGKDGILEFVDNVAKRTQSGNSFAAWREATPKHNELVETLLGAKLHLIVTMRSKMEYVQERDEKTGKTVIRKVGLQPVQRDGLEYEFDVVGDITANHELIVSKTRFDEIAHDKPYPKAGEQFAAILKAALAGVPRPAGNGHDRPASTAKAAEKPAPPEASASRVNGAPKPNGKTGGPFCHDCGQAIQGWTSPKGRVFTAEQIAAEAKGKFGDELCRDCGAARAKGGQGVTNGR